MFKTTIVQQKTPLVVPSSSTTTTAYVELTPDTAALSCPTDVYRDIQTFIPSIVALNAFNTAFRLSPHETFEIQKKESPYVPIYVKKNKDESLNLLGKSFALSWSNKTTQVSSNVKGPIDHMRRIYQWGTWILFSNPDSPTSSDALFDCENKEWKYSHNLVPHGAVVSVTLDGELLIAGGEIHDNPIDKVMMYTSPKVPGVKWPALNHKRTDAVHGLLTYGTDQVMIVAGGSSDLSLHDTCEYRNVKAPYHQKWTPCHALPFPAQTFSSIVWQNDVLVTILVGPAGVYLIYSYDWFAESGSHWVGLMEGLPVDCLNFKSILYLKNIDDLCVAKDDGQEFCRTKLDGEWEMIKEETDNDKPKKQTKSDERQLIGSLKLVELYQCFR